MASFYIMIMNTMVVLLSPSPPLRSAFPSKSHTRGKKRKRNMSQEMKPVELEKLDLLFVSANSNTECNAKERYITDEVM